MRTPLKFSLSKTPPLILQSEMAECALASIAMVACYHGHKLDMPAMRKRFSANLKGMNLQLVIELGDSCRVEHYSFLLMKFICYPLQVYCTGI